MNVRVPVDPHYAKLVGTAVYVFAYYEWIVVYIIERRSQGFLAEYSRVKKMPSGQVAGRFKALSENLGAQDPDADGLERCSAEFSSLVPRRNALIHAHPMTDAPGGSQLLNFQSRPSAQIADMKWTADAVKEFVRAVDEAAVRAGRLLDELGPSE